MWGEGLSRHCPHVLRLAAWPDLEADRWGRGFAFHNVIIILTHIFAPVCS